MKSNKKISAILTVFFLFLFIGASAGIPFSPLPGGEDVEVVVKKVFPSVVKVETQNWTKRVATGVIFDKKGHIVTTALVSPRNEKIAVITSDGKEYEAEFLGMDSETHIAVLRIKEKKLDPITIEKTKKLSSGTWIGVVSVSPENTPATSQGIVSSISNEALRLNVWVFPGWSGSPVVNKEGNMVGLLRGVYSDNQPVVFEFREREVVGSGLVYSRAEAPSSGVALAIPIDIVSEIAAEIIEKGKVERGWLGVYISENEEREVLITGIDDESPAQLANLREGDKMLKIDGKEITGSEMLSHEIRKRKPGRDINLEIERNGKVLKTRAKLGEYPEREAKRELEFKFPNLFPPMPSKPSKLPKVPRPPRVEIFPERLLPERFLRAWGSRKYIGVFLEELTDELSKFFGVKKGGGLLVSKFSEDSPAQKAGLKIGDVIVKVNGVQVNTIDQLSEFIQDKKKGEKIKIEFLRNKKQMSANVEVKEEEREGFFKRYFFSEDLSDSSESFSEINVVVPRIYFGLRI